jgi:hypothetical protein
VGFSTWWLGMIFGFFHGLLVALISNMIFPAMHPRMSSVDHGPTASRLLEPPGFLGMNYGYLTPVCVVIAHLAYGCIMGLMY